MFVPMQGSNVNVCTYSAMVMHLLTITKRVLAGDGQQRDSIGNLVQCTANPDVGHCNVRLYHKPWCISANQSHWFDNTCCCIFILWLCLILIFLPDVRPIVLPDYIVIQVMAGCLLYSKLTCADCMNGILCSNI